MDQTNQTKRGNGDLTVPCDMSNNASMMKLPHQKKHKMGATDTNNETQSLEQVQGIPGTSFKLSDDCQ